MPFGHPLEAAGRNEVCSPTATGFALIHVPVGIGSVTPAGAATITRAKARREAMTAAANLGREGSTAAWQNDETVIASPHVLCRRLCALAYLSWWPAHRLSRSARPTNVIETCALLLAHPERVRDRSQAELLRKCRNTSRSPRTGMKSWIRAPCEIERYVWRASSSIVCCGTRPPSLGTRRSATSWANVSSGCVSGCASMPDI